MFHLPVLLQLNSESPADGTPLEHKLARGRGLRTVLLKGGGSQETATQDLFLSPLSYSDASASSSCSSTSPSRSLSFSDSDESATASSWVEALREEDAEGNEETRNDVGGAGRPCAGARSQGEGRGDDGDGGEVEDRTCKEGRDQAYVARCQGLVNRF
jgi:hypothetical protein